MVITLTSEPAENIEGDSESPMNAAGGQGNLEVQGETGKHDALAQSSEKWSTTAPETPAEEARDVSIIDTARASLEVAADLFQEARARIEETAREFDEELASRNPDSKVDAGFQMAEETFSAAKNALQDTLHNLKQQLDSDKQGEKVLVDKTRQLAMSGAFLARQHLEVARQEFDEAASKLRGKIKEKEEYRKNNGKELSKEAEPSSG